MKIEIDPKKTTRANSFELWMDSPMPMVTMVKTIDVQRLRKVSRRKGMQFNMLLCWCIGKAAKGIKEFYILPEKGKLYKYDNLAINVVVKNSAGGINSCDIPFDDNIEVFDREYRKLTAEAHSKNKSSFLEDYMIIGTSAMIQSEIDCVVNQYTDKFCNPMVLWGKYRRKLFKTELPVSFQFHHVQMDGSDAAEYLERLAQTIMSL